MLWTLIKVFKIFSLSIFLFLQTKSKKSVDELFAKTEKDAKTIFPKECWNNLHLQIIWYGREYSPARGWDLEKDIITKTIGRKTVINEYYKKKAPK